MVRIGVTGTDTGVGKTVVATALLVLLRARGYGVAGMKPVETGVRRGMPGTDAARLAAAAGGPDPEDDVCPYALPDPLAPFMAARLAGATIELETLDRAVERLSRGRDAVVIEGAGGLLVPLTRGVRFDTLFRRWDAGVVIVAADRLGVINHTLLTVQAARDAGLAVHGVVLNPIGQDPGEISPQTNRLALAELLPDVPIVAFEALPRPDDLETLRAAAERCGLESVLPQELRAVQPTKPIP